jgi:hemoglobin
MDVEFLTDHDTEDALLEWCARRRREVVPGSVFIAIAGGLVLLDAAVLWRHEDALSVGLVTAMLFQVLAVAVAAVARDPGRTSPSPCPQAELITVGFIAASMVVTFEHRASLLALLLLTFMLVAFTALAIRGWHAFAFVRDRIEFYGHAQHVHIDDHGMDVTVRPNPQPRHIDWKSVRYLGADNRSLFVVAGVVPVVVPRRAFASPTTWHRFVSAAAEHAQAAAVEAPPRFARWSLSRRETLGFPRLRVARGTTVSMTSEPQELPDEGGESPCWAHLFDDTRHDIVGRDDIEHLVVAFYRDAAMDDLLGPIFHAAHVDWSVHIPKLVDFWAWQLFGNRGYDGNPLRAHEPAHARTPFRREHYERWLDLFVETVDAHFAGPVAEDAKARARRMAKALRRLLDGAAPASGDDAVAVTFTKPPG